MSCMCLGYKLTERFFNQKGLSLKTFFVVAYIWNC